MKTDDEMYQSLLSRWEDYKDNKRKNTTRIILVPAAVLGVCFAFWVAGNVNRIVKTGDSDHFVGSAMFSDSEESENDNDLLLVTEDDGNAHGYFNFNVVNDGVNKYGRFKAVNSSGVISFSGCPTGAARICIHSNGYDGPVECCIINPDTDISKQSISFSMTAGEYYYITIETWDDYIQTIGEFEIIDGETINNDVSENTLDYDTLLEPYRTAFDEFNKSHGTTYGFMSDEQLELHKMDKQQYLKETAEFYSKMSIEEFYDYLENAYREDMKKNEIINDDVIGLITAK